MRKITMTESATLDFPPIVEPAQEPAQSAIAVAPKSVVTIKEAAVAHLRSHEPTILALAERYRDVALPLDTPKGLAAGQAALTEVRENGRFAVQRARDATKDLLNGAKKDVEAEATRLIALIQPTEAHIEAQITARKAVLAAEKAERERIEAERVAKHQAGINIIRSYITQAQGKTSEQIARVLPTIEAIDCSPARFEEFSDEAYKALGKVLFALRELHDTTKAREEEAARLEAQRAEQARIAAEQAEAQRRLDEQAAELKRRQDEIDRVEREAQAKRDAEAEAARIAALPAAVSVSPVDDKAGSVSPLAESEPQADPTEALPIAAAKSMDLPEAIEQAPTEASATAATAPNRWQGGEGWESLAWELCADENGEDACNELIWEGGAIPEPWGERWLKYEGEAKRLIALVRKHAAIQALTLTGHQLLEALEFVSPARDADQLDCEVSIAWRDAGVDTEGEAFEAGLCCWLTEYPEEGCIPLTGKVEQL